MLRRRLVFVTELPGWCLGDLGLFLSLLPSSCSDTGWEALSILCSIPGIIPITASDNPCYRFKTDMRQVNIFVQGSHDALPGIKSVNHLHLLCEWLNQDLRSLEEDCNLITVITS